MTEGIDATEGDSGATQVEAIAVVLVDLPPVLEAVLEELRLEWAYRHQVLVVLREVLAVVASVVLPADLAVVLGDLPAVLAVETARAGSAR